MLTRSNGDSSDCAAGECKFSNSKAKAGRMRKMKEISDLDSGVGVSFDSSSSGNNNDDVRQKARNS